MPKKFSPWELDHQWLLHETVQGEVFPSFVPHFICAVIREGADLDDLVDAVGEDATRSPSYPAMMSSLICFGLQQGIDSPPQLARACETRIDFMALTGLQRTSAQDIRDFTAAAGAALTEVMATFIAISRRLGVPLRGDDDAEEDIDAVAAGWLARFEASDDDSDSEGDEPDWLESKAKRLRKIRDAKAAIAADLEKKERARAAARRRPEPEPEPELAEEEEEEDDAGFAEFRASRRTGRRGRKPLRAARAGGSRRPRRREPEPEPEPEEEEERGGMDQFMTNRPEHERALLMEVMIAVALADGHVAAIEQRRIDQMMRIMRLDTRARQEILAVLRSGEIPELPPHDELPDYEICLHIFEQAAVMALADGIIDPNEKRYLRQLAGTLELDVEDAKEALRKANETAGRP